MRQRCDGGRSRCYTGMPLARNELMLDVWREEEGLARAWQ